MGTKRRLDARQRARVVQLVERDKLTQAVVAERFGVSQPVITNALREAREARAAMRKVSLAERREIAAEYRGTIKSVGALAQQFTLTKRDVAYILYTEGVVRPRRRQSAYGRLLGNALADGRGLAAYRHAARVGRAVRRLDEMMTELRAAQSETGRTYLAGLITRAQRSPGGGCVRLEPEHTARAN